MAALPSEDFIPAPIASDNADFIPAPIAQDDEDFIPSTLTPEQTVIEALAGVEGYSAAVQTAAEYGDNPTLRPLFVKALADRQKKQASKSTEDSLNDAAKIALALPGIAGRTLYSVVTESIPAVANNVKSLFAGNPAEQLQAVGEAGSAISGAAVSTLELLRKGYENVSDSVTFSKPSLSRGLEIARNPLLIAQPSKAILQSDEEYERRADADLLGAKTIKEAASGGLLPGGIREKVAALGSPIRPEVSEKLQVAYDPLNWVPFGAGFVVGKVGNALGLGVRTAGGVEVVAKGLQKLADVENAAETVGVLRRGVGATVSGAGQKVVRASDSPAVVGTIAGATALAGGAEPVTAMLATLIGAGTVRGAGPVADVLKSSGRTLVRVGDQIAGKASLGPMGRFAESAVNFVKPSIVEGGQSGLALGLPFALSARDEQDVADVLGSSAAFGVGGHLVGQVVGAGNRYFSIDSAFRDSTAKVPDSAYERPEFSYYSQDQGNVVEAKSREVFDTLSNKGAQTVEALKKLFVKPDANGIKTEIYILDRATSDALAKQYAGSEQGRAGFSVEIPDQKRRLVVINADSNGGISLGHEVGHAFYASLPYAQKKALLDTVSKTIRPDDFAQLKTRYEELFNQKRNEDGSYTPVPEAERVKISDDYAAQEYLAENFSAYLNGVPIEKFGTPRGLADRIRVSIGAVLEKGGARRLTTDNSAAVRTELGYKPSAALAELYQNFIEARKLDNTTLTTINGEAAPVDVALPPVEVPTDRATIAPVSTNAPASPLANIREVEAKPVVPGFKKGDPIGEIRDRDGMLIAEDAKVLRKNEDGTYEIEFIDPDTGKRLIATTDEASLVSPISPGKVDPNKTVFPASPVTPQTPFFAATAPTPPTAATTVAPKQVENVARPQGSVATPNLRPGAASAFVKKAPDTLHSANRQVLEGLMSAPRAEIPAVETDYYAAASPVQSPDAIVRAAQRKAADALEKSGEPNPFRAAFQKLFVPYRWSSYKLDAATNARLYGEGAPRQPGGIYGMSVDKVGQNLDLLRGLAKENSAVAETLSAFGVSQDYLASDALVSDFRTYLDNQAHGYGGDGRKLSLPADTRPGTITAQDPNFVPTALPANKRQLFNLLLNLEQQATRTPGMEFSARFAKQNGIDPLTVGFDDKGRPLTDNNALRAALLRNNFDPRLLNSAVENLPTENFTSAIKVRPDVALPAADVAITQAGFMPETSGSRRPQGNDETRSVAAQYTQKAGIQAAPHDTYAPTNETTLKRIADFYENAKHEPEKPEVQKAYRALAEETRAQYDEMLANGIKIEPYEGKGEPYANSAAMLADIRDNKHLYFFLTKNAFGEGADSGNNALLEKSGIKINGVDLLYNDLFRAVHDYFGHTAEGFEFGPRGEYNAYLAHSRMFSDEAKPALAAETLAQNAWVNFGPQLRREDGSLPKAGDADFVPIAKRRFADQKNTVVPPELLQAADPQAAFMPEDSQLEGFGESMREKMRAKMAKVEPSGYEEGDKFELPSGKVVEFVSDLLPKNGGARDGAQMAYVRFEDGMESSVYLDDLTKTYGPGGSFMPEAPDTPAFKKWFGDSKVVDWAGKPLRVYHGTKADFDSFSREAAGTNTGAKNTRLGFFFTDSPEVASSFGDRVVPAFVSIKNPLEIGFDEPARRGGIKRLVDGYEPLKAAIAKKSGKKSWADVTSEDVDAYRDLLKGFGYDGIVITTDTDATGFGSAGNAVGGRPLIRMEPHRMFVAFEPTQIKSATGNRGTFDATNPDIRYLPERQFDAPKRLPDAIKDRTLTLVHKGPAGVGELDPARFGKSGITPRSELAGEPRVFFYVKGFENKSDPSQLRGNTYEIPVSGKRIYDADTDALDWTQDVNRQRADIMLKDAGYAGLIRTRGKGKDLFKQVEIFEKVSVNGTPVSETDVRTPRNRLETPEGRKVAAQLREKFGSTGAYFDRLQEYKDTGNIRFMPEALESPEFKKWFGDSKVVDESGAPEVVYHSTTYGDFNEFKKSQQAKGMAGFGFYFTDQKGSNLYSDMSMKFKFDKSFSGEDKKTNVMPVYLKLENPLRADDIQEVYEKYGKKQPGSFSQRRDFVESSRYRFGLPTDIKLNIEEAGYDGVITNETIKRNRDGSYSIVDPGTKGGITHPVYVVFEPNQIKSATGNRGTFDATNPDIRYMPEADDIRLTRPYKEIAKFLTPEERSKIRKDTAADMLKIFKELPADVEFEAAVKMGLLKKGWYERAGRSLRTIFGNDTENFVGVLAATSPRQSVQLNMEMAFDIWEKYLEAGRPEDAATIKELVKPLVGLPARENNTIRALLGKDLEDIPIASSKKFDEDTKMSGFKVESFRRNLLGDLQASTNDAWMAQFAGISQTLFGTKAGYAAFNAKVRRVANTLDLKPAEVQETIWSFFKTLVEGTVGGRSSAETLASLTQGDILNTPEFYEELLKNPKVAAVLERLGIDTAAILDNENPAKAGADPTLPLAGITLEGGQDSRRVLERVVARAQKIKDQSLAEETATRNRVEPTDDENPF